MKILLINPRIEEGKAVPVFPLGLGYIASMAKNTGYNVEVLDLNANYKYTNERIENIIAKTEFDIAGISAVIPHFSQVQWISRIIKKSHPQTRVILGGGLGSAASNLVFTETSVDIIVMGEGEGTIVKLLEVMKANEDLQKVMGIKYIKDGNIIQTPSRAFIENLDEIPFPSWDLFPMDFYINTPDWLFEIPKAEIITSRGCPYNCTFCYHGIFGYKYRRRSPENIVLEIKTLKDKYGIKAITFRDDTFTLDRERVFIFCRLLIESNMNIWWICNGRANILDNEILKIMKKAGCVGVNFGIESGDPINLKRINKQITLGQVKSVVKNVYKNNMIPHGYAIIGFPNETRKSIDMTIKYFISLGLTAEFNVLTPIPGTILYEEMVREGKIGNEKELLANWSNWLKKTVINLSNLSDEELALIKHKAEKILLNRVLIKNWKFIILLYYLYARINGWGSLTKRILRSIYRFWKLNICSIE
jgi:anaerobic magnesium-protoporphyrin IX monomethyl ester cyclase